MADNEQQQEAPKGRDMSQANPLSKAAHGSSPGVPRSIRSRTGQTTDPIPDGMHLEEKKVRLPMVAAETEEGEQSPSELAAIAQGAHPQSSKEDKKAHKEELERLHGDAKAKQTNAQANSGPSGPSMPAQKNMDSRRSHYGQAQHSRQS
mmetsp:Transcript_13496/g.40823  ORF Transcript_13496/g.40823 Transcript_13496/m.40823 type:complete len:149 (-) Transcript_13496:538-984(-)